MKQRLSYALIFMSLALFAACGGQATTGEPAAPAPAAAAPTGPVSVYDGVYTAAQATRGQQLMQSECSACHSPQDWAQGRLLGGWQNQPALALVDLIRNTMPMDGPGRLTFEQYTDIFSAILQLNDIPTGSTELAANEDALRNVTIEYRR
jgi:mono/diheme cytochrome c family protein